MLISTISFNSPQEFEQVKQFLNHYNIITTKISTYYENVQSEAELIEDINTILLYTSNDIYTNINKIAHYIVIDNYQCFNRIFNKKISTKKLEQYIVETNTFSIMLNDLYRIENVIIDALVEITHNMIWLILLDKMTALLNYNSSTKINTTIQKIYNKIFNKITIYVDEIAHPIIIQLCQLVINYRNK